MHPGIAEVDLALKGAGGLPDGCGCVVAVSGGRDSMVLLHVLSELRRRREWRLVVAHFNHRLRAAAEVEADARFVADAAAERGLPFVGGISGSPGPTRGESIEAQARTWRHAFLARAAREHACGWIATGHHAGDQAELFLMRLLRGAGGVGLGGMQVVDASPADPALRLVRPLLKVERSAMDPWAKEWGVRFRQDPSNEDRSFLRNRVRHELIPLLESRFQPALGRLLEREQSILRGQAEVMEGLTTAWLAREDPRAFDALPTGLQRAVLKEQIERLGVRSGFEWIEALRGNPGTPVPVAPGQVLRRDAAGIVRLTLVEDGNRRFSLAEQVLELGERAGHAEFGGGRIEWRTSEAGSDGHAGTATDGIPRTEQFDAAAVGRTVRLRHWRPGDRFQPIGLGSPAKLQDLFTNARVPPAERRRRVLAEAIDGRILWVEGLRIGEAVKVTGATDRILAWRWRRSEPST